MEDPVFYWNVEIPKDYDALLFDFIQLLEKHNRLVEKYNYTKENREVLKDKDN
jgi:hypothetical protein